MIHLFAGFCHLYHFQVQESNLHFFPAEVTCILLFYQFLSSSYFLWMGTPDLHILTIIYRGGKNEVYNCNTNK